MKKVHLDKKKVIIAGILIILFFLMMDLNSRLMDLNRLTRQYDQMTTKVAELTATVQQLNTEIAYSTSVIAVEQWARENGHMIQPGDVLIVPISPNQATPEPVFVEEPTPYVASNSEVWKALFFGEN
ncbi:MAG: septum formation initiator family protein [Anaerolineaceae bacterium]|jgi:cell division protein FtsB